MGWGWGVGEEGEGEGKKEGFFYRNHYMCIVRNYYMWGLIGTQRVVLIENLQV